MRTGKCGFIRRTLLETVHCDGGVLDVQFAPQRPNLLGCALDNGRVAVYMLHTGPCTFLSLQCSVPVKPEPTTVLALAWHPTYADVLAVSLESGSVEMLELVSSEDTLSLHVVLPNIQQHDFHAWTLAFMSGSGRASDSGDFYLVSGGDDAVVRYSLFPDPQPSQPGPVVPQSPLRKVHAAGVTALLPLPPREDDWDQGLVLTGSFDEHIRLVHLGTRHVQVERKLEGGVWRLRFMEDDAATSDALVSGVSSGSRSRTTFLVLACCMEAGARVLEVVRAEDGRWSIDVLGHFIEHQSLTYGADIQPREPEPGLVEEPRVGTRSAMMMIPPRPSTCVTVSFYDRRLCIWDFAAGGAPCSSTTPDTAEQMECCKPK